MRIRLRLFGPAREAAKADEVDLDVPDAACVRDVLAALATRADALGPVALRSRLAVNQALAADDTPIKPGDELALIPPVGGG